MRFVIETEQGNRDAGRVVLPRAVAKSIGVLYTLEPGRMITIGRLAEKIGITKSTLHNHVTHKALEPYRIHIGYHEVYYASRETVEEWRKDEGRDDA